MFIFGTNIIAIVYAYSINVLFFQANAASQLFEMVIPIILINTVGFLFSYLATDKLINPLTIFGKGIQDCLNKKNSEVKPSKIVVEDIFTSIDKFVFGAEQSDDITILSLKI